MLKNKLYLLSFLIFLFFACHEKASKPKESAVPLDTLPKDFVSEFSLSPEQKNRKSDSIHAKEKSRLIEEYLEKKFNKRGFNGCILVEQAGVELFRNCYGNTCLPCEESDSIDQNTLFQLASLSKTFTAVAILKLVEDKKLSLEDSVQKFFPNFPYKDVSVRSLLSHRSGLPNYMYVFEDSSKVSEAPDNQTLMTWFEQSKPRAYTSPNKRFSYNNTNYAILAAIIEKVTGITYSAYIEKSVCQPLGMNHTHVCNDIPFNQIMTKGHERNRIVPKDYFDDIVGDKGIYSSLDDLIIWYKSLQRHKLLSEEMLEEAFTPQSMESRGVRNYGLGFRMTLDKETQKPKYIYHNGWWKGYNTVFWFSPETESFVVMLSNVKNKSIYKMKPLIQILENMPDTEEEENEEEEEL